MIYAYTAGFVWMLIYFNLGRTFPYAYKSILENLQVFLVLLSAAIIAILLARYLYKQRKARNQ